MLDRFPVRRYPVRCAADARAAIGSVAVDLTPGHGHDLDRRSQHVCSDRPILEGARRFIGCKSPALAEKH